MSLRTLVRTSKAVGEFRKIEARLSRPFTDPLALVEFLASRESDQDEREAIYRVIVSAAQNGSHFAVVVLWLGLWAALDSIYRKNCRRYGDHPQELVADLGGCFMEVIKAARLDHIQRLAATLVMNTERRLDKAKKRADKIARTQDELPKDTARDVPRVDAPAASAFGMDLVREGVPGLRTAEKWLREHLSEADAKLLAATIIEERTQKSFADQQGLTPGAVRKQHQRALGRLQALSHFVDPQRVYRMRGKRPPPGRPR